MTAPRGRGRVAVRTLLTVLIALGAGAAALHAKAARGGTPTVLVARLDGAVSPVSAEALIAAIDRAERDGDAALVIEIDTPGGLESSMREIVKRMLIAKVPVIAWVSPRGSRAASAGVFVTMAADIAAMAPGTNIGAATPVNLQGGMDSTMARKVTNDASAFARTIAAQRGRNAVWAERAVREAVAVDEREAVELHVVDVVVDSMDELLRAADAKGWRGGALHLAGARIERIHPGLRQRILGLLVDPNIAYVLMLLGFYGLLFELQNPGAILPGVIGGISLVLAFLALSALPVNAAGVALILLAIVFFLAEIKVASHGVLAAGGALALVLGSLILFRGEGVRVSYGLIAGAAVATTVFFVGVIGAGLRAQRRPVRTGSAALVGARGQALERLDRGGRVRIGNEVWSAVATAPVELGSEVVVTGVDRLTLRVRAASGEE